MRMTMKTDEKELERNLKRASKAFGDSTGQSTFRWGIQIARELAGATQAFGKGSKTLTIQKKAIYFDALNVVRLVKSNPQIKNPQECYSWIEQNRTRARRRTARLPDNQRKTCTLETLEQSLEKRFTNAGQAKGAWIGSGQDLMAKQRGTEQIRIGKSYLKHAQKHAGLGHARNKSGLFTSSTILANESSHSSDQTVIPDTKKKQIVKRSLINAIKWYDKAATAKMKKL